VEVPVNVDELPELPELLVLGVWTGAGVGDAEIGGVDVALGGFVAVGTEIDGAEGDPPDNCALLQEDAPLPKPQIGL